jgi:hypothetical protein
MTLSAKRESLSFWISLALLGNGVPENNEQQDDRLQRILAGFGFGKAGTFLTIPIMRLRKPLRLRIIGFF